MVVAVIRPMTLEEVVFQIPDEIFESSWLASLPQYETDTQVREILAVKVYGQHVHLLEDEMIDRFANQELWGLAFNDWREGALASKRARTVFIKRMYAMRSPTSPDFNVQIDAVTGPHLFRLQYDGMETLKDTSFGCEVFIFLTEVSEWVGYKDEDGNNVIQTLDKDSTNRI